MLVYSYWFYLVVKLQYFFVSRITCNVKFLKNSTFYTFKPRLGCIEAIIKVVWMLFLLKNSFLLCVDGALVGACHVLYRKLTFLCTSGCDFLNFVLSLCRFREFWPYIVIVWKSVEYKIGTVSRSYILTMMPCLFSGFITSSQWFYSFISVLLSCHLGFFSGSFHCFYGFLQ